jgi:hypothetical protein
MKDPALSICSAGARGVWMDVLCLMFESPERGYLMTNGKPWTLEQIAIALRGDWQENMVYLKELVHNGVLKQVKMSKRQTRECPRKVAAFYSARLVTDEAVRCEWRSQKRRQRIEKKRSLSTHLSGLSSSSSSSSSSNLNTKTPLPPAGAGDSTEKFMRWSFETIGVQMGRHHRLPNFNSFAGAQAARVVEFLQQQGFRARVVPAEEVEMWERLAKGAANG